MSDNKTTFGAKPKNGSGKVNANVDNGILADYVEKLQKMLQCKTVYNIDKYDDTEFKKFRGVLVENFPLLNKYGELRIFGSGCIVYKIRGKNTAKNVMLMSHHDVVEPGEGWKYPPFGAEIHDGCIWARGAIDTKTPLFGELQAVEELLSEGFEFPMNVYIASSNNEEICGDGIVKAVEYFKENGVRFDFLIDEGGAITEKTVPGVKEKCAMIAVHEKGRHTFICTAKKDASKSAGHSGLTCKSDNPVTRMSLFIAETERAEWAKKFYPEVKATFEHTAPHMSFGYRLLFSHLGLFEKLLLKIMPKVNGQIGAMLGDTVSFTSIGGSGKYGMVQPSEVTATAFFRCVRDTDLAVSVEKFKQIAAEYGITVVPDVVDFCQPSSFENDKYRLIESILNDNFPDAVVAPFLLTAGSDARRFTDICSNIYRFAPLDVSTEQFKTIHSANENVSVENVGEVVLFYKELLKRYGGIN